MLFDLKEKLFGKKRQSKSLAKSRLHFVLVQDRTGLTNDELASFKKELVTVIEKYFVIDKQGFDIDYQREVDTRASFSAAKSFVSRRAGRNLAAGGLIILVHRKFLTSAPYGGVQVRRI